MLIEDINGWIKRRKTLVWKVNPDFYISLTKCISNIFIYKNSHFGMFNKKKVTILQFNS